MREGDDWFGLTREELLEGVRSFFLSLLSLSLCQFLPRAAIQLLRPLDPESVSQVVESARPILFLLHDYVELL